MIEAVDQWVLGSLAVWGWVRAARFQRELGGMRRGLAGIVARERAGRIIRLPDLDEGEARRAG